jgi:pre-60S factor REI1
VVDLPRFAGRKLPVPNQPNCTNQNPNPLHSKRPQVPLYCAGDDPAARQFRSLHAVQRHMVDAGRCKLLYDGNEDEYAEFYDYSAQDGGDGEGVGEEDGGVGGEEAGGGVVTAAAVDALAERFAMSGLEMVVGEGGGGGGGKVLGSRWLARYYKQRPRPGGAAERGAGRGGAAAAGALQLPGAAGHVVAQYKALGIETRHAASTHVRRAQKSVQRGERHRLNLAMRTNVNNNLPNNVPY